MPGLASDRLDWENHSRWKAPGSSSRRAIFADARLKGNVLFKEAEPEDGSWPVRKAMRLSRVSCARPVTERCSRLVRAGALSPRIGETLDSVILGRCARCFAIRRETSWRAARSFAADSRAFGRGVRLKPSGGEATCSGEFQQTRRGTTALAWCAHAACCRCRSRSRMSRVKHHGSLRSGMVHHTSPSGRPHRVKRHRTSGHDGKIMRSMSADRTSG